MMRLVAGLSLVPALIVSMAAGCTGSDRPLITMDGSSTVYPIAEAMAEEFQTGRRVRLSLGKSGTGGGFEKFGQGESEINNASRPIKQEEIESLATTDHDFIELPIAYDGIAIVVHPENDWVDHLTVEELRRMWEADAQGEVMQWSDVRDGWPDEELELYGPGTDSGTYDYFTEAICGEEGASRGDFTPSEDDNVLVHGVANDRLALAFFGYAYYHENRDRLKVVPIDDGDPSNGEGAVTPSPETIGSFTYQPLSRPLFMYVRQDAADRPEIQEYIRFFLTEGPPLVAEVGFVPLSDRTYELVLERFESRTTGSLFTGGSQVGVSVEELLTDDGTGDGPGGEE